MIPKTTPKKIIADFSIALSRFPLVFVNVPVLMNYESDCILICISEYVTIAAGVR